MERRNIYAIYENGKLIDQGLSTDIAYRYHVSVKGLSAYARRKYKLLGMYDVVMIGKEGSKIDEQKIKEEEIKIEKEKEETVKEKIFNYLYKHLDKYGNTVLNEEDDPFQYLPELEERMGKEIWTRRVIEKDDPFNYEADEFNEGKFKRGRIKYFYVLEVK